jgi:hypothetical protein
MPYTATQAVRAFNHLLAQHEASLGLPPRTEPRHEDDDCDYIFDYMDLVCDKMNVSPRDFHLAELNCNLKWFRHKNPK